MPTEEPESADGQGRLEPRTKRQVAGTVIARWQSTSKALIKLETGDVVEAVGAEQLKDAFEIGADVNVYFDSVGAMVGWMLADLNTGVNLERSEPG